MMKNAYILVPLIACSLFQVSRAALPKIKFSGEKGWVLTSAEREAVLAVADEHLNSKNSDFLAQLDDVKSPFFTEEPEVAVAAVEPKAQVQAEEVQAPEPVEVVYEDASVLKGAAESFAKQVRGTLARGDQNYIQLQGGNLLKAGSSFPVRLRELNDKAYVVKLIEVTSNDYTLSLGDATLTLRYSDGTTGARKTP